MSGRSRESVCRARRAQPTHLAAARRAGDPARLRTARAAVDDAKAALGERGPVWWSDGAPNYNLRLVKNTPYAPWYAAQEFRGPRA